MQNSKVLTVGRAACGRIVRCARGYARARPSGHFHGLRHWALAYRMCSWTTSSNSNCSTNTPCWCDCCEWRKVSSSIDTRTALKNLSNLLMNFLLGGDSSAQRPVLFVCALGYYYINTMHNWVNILMKPLPPW